ncbi:MAG: DUF4382 domain-containing protein [Bacteroidetes bacterium]|nr:DUF4382 domain-containing protein [Bacteroidota bacterium]
MKKQVKIWLGLCCLTLFVTFIITACKKENSVSTVTTVPAGKQTVAVYLNDDPVPKFTKVLIDIKYIEVKIDTGKMHHEDDYYNADHDGDNDHHDGDHFGKWDTLSVTPRKYDLLKLKNGMDTLIANGFANVGKITKIRITLGADNSVWTDSAHSDPLPLCDSKPYVYIKVYANSIDSLPGGQHRIRIDFDVAKSIESENGHLCLWPKLKSYSERTTGKIEGKVKPKDAHAQIIAYNLTDTAYAIPEEDGEFQIRGLKPASYNVLYKATSPYMDTTINNVQVQKGTETKLPTITLH